MYRQKNNPLTSISGSITYDYFLEGTHGLISVNRKRYKKYVKKHNSFLKEMIFADSHVGIEERVHRACIAGVDVYQFPAFMKAVELHYLIRSVMSNDIVPRKQSYFNPCIFIKRGYRLWKIIYELDINQHHQYDNLLSSFEVYTDIEKIRCEYENILTHGISYFALIISIISSIIALT